MVPFPFTRTEENEMYKIRIAIAAGETPIDVIETNNKDITEWLGKYFLDRLHYTIVWHQDQHTIVDEKHHIITFHLENLDEIGMIPEDFSLRMLPDLNKPDQNQFFGYLKDGDENKALTFGWTKESHAYKWAITLPITVDA